MPLSEPGLDPMQNPLLMKRLTAALRKRDPRLTPQNAYWRVRSVARRGADSPYYDEVRAAAVDCCYETWAELVRPLIPVGQQIIRSLVPAVRSAARLAEAYGDILRGRPDRAAHHSPYGPPPRRGRR
ncbi:hypothetical protein [Streptomyces sp. DH37]|uniref:hypothetical protein n=1 Tax=Streptomyces sp. DH37 TaxID=3040122 RepID=UPI002441553C|nr:hypothetical protein [Streptomyces sp. DH37]MDG9703765.1 hypothetical protein [Streptomyces sp. DH37]